VSHLITRVISAIAPIYDPIIDRFLGGEMRVRRKFLERVGPFERGVDIGCGTGRFAAMLANAGKGGEMEGMDVSARMIRYAERHHPGIRFRVADVRSLPYEDGEFDAVFSTMMMHHLTEREKGAAVREICRVLKQDGKYYSLEFNRDGLTLTGRAVTGLGFLEDSHLQGLEIEEKEVWDKGLVWRICSKMR